MFIYTAHTYIVYLFDVVVVVSVSEHREQLETGVKPLVAHVNTYSATYNVK